MKSLVIFLCLLFVSLGTQASAETDLNGAEGDQVFYSCQADSDCEVMNIGSCCGYNPACVNKESRPDPEVVAEKCQESGLSGVCGYTEIEKCFCDQGTCKAVTPMQDVESF